MAYTGDGCGDETGTFPTPNFRKNEVFVGIIERACFNEQLSINVGNNTYIVRKLGLKMLIFIKFVGANKIYFKLF